jgi:hypothetical protein
MDQSIPKQLDAAGDAFTVGKGHAASFEIQSAASTEIRIILEPANETPEYAFCPMH